MRISVALLLLCLFAPTIRARTHLSQKPRPSAVSKARQFDQLSRDADKAREEGRDEDAIRSYKNALKLQPEWKQGLWYAGFLSYKKDQYVDARDLLRRFVAFEPQAGAGWALLGMSEFQTRDYARSLDHLERARTLTLGDNKEMAQALFYCVSVLLIRSERYDDAMALLMAMVKSGSFTDLTEPIGLAALRYPFLPSEIPAGRKELFQMAGKAALAQADHRDEEAEGLFRTMLADFPNEPGVHFLHGIFLLTLRPEDGVKELKRELEIAPYNFTAKLRLADQYLKEEKNEDALQLAEEVLKIDPNYATGHLVMGEALVAKGDLQKGIQELETSSKLRPQIVRTHWDLLRAYMSAGRTKDAEHERQQIEALRRPNAQP